MKVELAKSCQCLDSFVFVEVVYDSWIFPLRTADGEDTQGCHLDGSATSTRQLSSTSMNQFNFGPGPGPGRPPTARARNRKNKNSDLLTFQVPQTWWHDVIVLNVLTNIWFPFNCEFATIVFVCYLKQNIKTIKNSNLTTVFWFWLGRESFFSLPINFFGETQVLDWISLHNFPNIQIQYFYKSTSRNCRTSKDQGYWVAMCVGEVGKSSIAISFFRI